MLSEAALPQRFCRAFYLNDRWAIARDPINDTRIAVDEVHVLRNAAIPVITLAGDEIAGLVNGSVVIEVIFGWPGIGQLAWQAIQQIDIPIIMGVTLVSAFAIIIGNLIADLIAPLIDPRIKLR